MEALNNLGEKKTVKVFPFGFFRKCDFLMYENLLDAILSSHHSSSSFPKKINNIIVPFITIINFS